MAFRGCCYGFRVFWVLYGFRIGVLMKIEYYSNDSKEPHGLGIAFFAHPGFYVASDLYV